MLIPTSKATVLPGQMEFPFLTEMKFLENTIRSVETSEEVETDTSVFSLNQEAA